MGDYLEDRIAIVGDFDTIDGDLAFWDIDSLAGASKLVGTLTVNLNSAENRGFLDDLTGELGYCLADFVECWDAIRYGRDLAFWVAGGRIGTENDCSLVDFVELRELTSALGEFTSDDEHETGGEGVESAGVADFDAVAGLLAENATDSGYDAETAESGRFIYKKEAVFG